MNTLKYYLFDSCNEDEIMGVFTFRELQDWLIDFWNNNPDEDMDKEEHEELIFDIICSCDEEDLCNRFMGVGYWIEEIEAAI